MIKKIVLGLLIALGMSSCCKPLIEGFINISYPSIEEPTDVWVLQTVKSDLSLVLDTLYKVELNESNQFSFNFDLFNRESYSYLIQTDSLIYSDTITDISYEISGVNCNQKVENLQYSLNGTPLTNLSPEIE